MNYETPLEAEAEDARAPEEDAVTATDDGVPRRKLIFLAIFAGVVLLVVAFLIHSGRDSGLSEEDGSSLPVVSVLAPGMTSVTGQINATGSLAARREMPVGVVGDGGRVVSVPVEPGQWVRRGQVLAVIDRSVQSQQIASAAAQVAAAKADADLAQSNLDRALKLVDRGFISKADVDRLTATRDAAVARVGVARAQLGELRARAARLDILTPEAGLLLTRNVEPGQVVSGGPTVLFSVAKAGEMELLARLSEEDLARIRVGQTAQVIPVGSDKSFTGQIWQVSPVIDDQTRQGTARIALSYAPELRPGGFASATIQGGTVVAPLLPESAIQNDEQGSFVFVVGKDNKVARRAVKTGLVTEQGIVITDGLNGKERVVYRAGAFLSAGEKIKPKLVKPAAE
ncbi:efflux transporter periplasmic adaptor subunit [Croceicoccus estronivorus]|uniref:efflux RND transporter periplasmic adaptor subunit n=1 Tax=Croceicoccus estronivorus TaxID=1172626 RepID=UPI00082E1BD2|nr:efflux RND transporter periplasmic adaptor subunit [Croceicoccus estronivorus]OCC24042.1 efflux transporter periplasmic adaptor subunit [Croceicoccus estronivorus]